jgi:hypothetical protein
MKDLERETVKNAKGESDTTTNDNEANVLP